MTGLVTGVPFGNPRAVHTRLRIALNTPLQGFVKNKKVSYNILVVLHNRAAIILD